MNQLFPSLSISAIEVPLLEEVNFESFVLPLQDMDQVQVNTAFSYSLLLVYLYFVLVAINFLRIFLQTRRLFLLRRESLIQSKSGYQLIYADVNEVFSFFNWVFVPRHKLDQNNPEIIEHERQHIQLKHSWDVVFAELFIAFFWFNPLSYVYRKSLKSVHEFQADKGVLAQGTKTSSYMLLLMQSLEIQEPKNLYNYFNQSLLKKRVNMMTKAKSKSLSKLSYLLLFLAGGLLISAFASPLIEGNENLESINPLSNSKNSPSLFPVQNGDKEDISAHFGATGRDPRNKAQIHGGIDIKGKSGTAILATADGTVHTASKKGNWGNLIIISHADGYETWYAHLQGFNTVQNQSVKQGDIIGYLGNTGKSSSPHLHYEVKQNGNRLNPMDYLK